MSSPEEIFSKLIPKINKSFGEDGKGKKLLFNAFTKAGFPFDESNFPTVVFDASAEHLNLLFADAGHYGYSARQEHTLLVHKLALLLSIHKHYTN